MADGDWFTTRSALFKPGDHVWNEVARYEGPLEAYLTQRYSHPRWGLDDADRADLLQSILLEIKELLVERYDRTRGQFRALLRTVIARKVRKLAQEKRRTLPEPQEPLPAPEVEDVDSLDLETSLLAALTDCHDHYVEAQELDVVWVLSDRLVHGLKSTEVARKRGLSERQVGGRLQRARERIFAALLSRELDLPRGGPELAPCVEAFRACLREPRRQTRIADELPSSLREPFEDFMRRFRATLRLFRGSDSVRYQDLARGVLEVFAPAEPDVLLGEAS